MAYNAPLQLATAALAATGYRASREAHHYRVVQSLAFTTGADARVVAQLDRFRKKRNISDYERAGVVADQEVKEMLALPESLSTSVREWLQTNYPEFVQE